jgi:hypothetical protein
VHSAAAIALGDGDGDGGTLGVTVGLMLGVSVGLAVVAGAEGVADDCDVAIDAGGEAAGVLEPPVQPATAMTVLSAQTWTTRRTRRA